MADEKTGNPLDSMTAPLQAVAEGLDGPVGELAKANAAAGRQWLEGFGRMSQELMAFSSSRMQEDLQTMQRLAACSDPGEAMQVQCDCLNRMVKAYADEAQRLCEMASETGANCLESADQDIGGARKPAA